MKFIVQESIFRSYEVEAEDFDEAIAKACEMTPAEASSMDSVGFTYVYNSDNGADLIL